MPKEERARVKMFAAWLLQRGENAMAAEVLSLIADLEAAEARAEDLQAVLANDKERIALAQRATAEGCLAAARGEPLHYVAKTRYRARSIGGDAWEAGWEYIKAAHLADEWKLRAERAEATLREIAGHDSDTCSGIMAADCLESVQEIARAALMDRKEGVIDG